jgi:hypothetical protein
MTPRRITAVVIGAAIPIVLAYFGVVPPVASLVAVAILLGALYWTLRAHVHAILLVFLAVIAVTTIASRPAPRIAAQNVLDDNPDALVGAWRGKGPFDDRLPIVVHILLDEMQSTGAMPPDVPDAAAVRRTLYDLGERHGLTTYDSVYSRHYFSGISIPNLFNAGFEGRTALEAQSGTIQEHVVANAYFDAMAARGYRTAVFQTAVLDFCHNPHVLLCETLPSFDPSSAMHGDLRSRELNLWETLLRSSEPSYASQYGNLLLRHVYGLQQRDVGVLGTADRYDVQRFPSWFDRFVGFVRQVPRGTHVFAHFMTPHSPYLLTSDCVVSGSYDAGYYLDQRFLALADRQDARQRYYADYLSQVGCVVKKLDALFGALSQVPAFSDATIVIHGDHGSRISAGNLIEDYGSRDFVDNYAAYFAVKAPGVTPGVNCEMLALEEAFRRYLGPQSTAAAAHAPGGHLPVVVGSHAGAAIRVEAPMPAFGCGAQ